VKRRFRFGRTALSLTAFAVMVATAAVLLVTTAGPPHAAGAASRNGPFPADFIDIRHVPKSVPATPGPNASTGTVTEDCGRDEENHRNDDNLVQSPRFAGGAHHTHDYVGNLSTTAFSTDASLAAAGTTCANGDRSTYFWPVLRRQDQQGSGVYAQGSGHHGNVGAILPPSSVTVQYRGNPASAVVPMPRFLRLMTGDPVAGTVGLAQARAQWGCTGFPDRHTMLYPRCPDGDQVTRTMDFPNCWNGLDTDSMLDHRSHVGFAASDGVCPAGMFPIPQLRVVISYDVPKGAPIAVDAFSEQKHNPVTDHAGYVDVMTQAQMAKVVRCLNEGHRC
jgi:hypothetical protein